ncbi:biotin--[acetyl-CoA-carboxylase] ligase [Sediminicoccus sp. KRV36]|uniref:biotin--[acetyl-CoA-carboxylase] ligase n=1 Tax=Sediminicoccus sp. KRV36 TaxID=3133721 RepID=UPI00200CC26D|nr:biotin--[acetyl-CoA-carboxylase] ligase [Sediminicoccus rosea]UPY38399.1 biotin--[acetyl-CoA-carboxylase] ligase [Sediminicoccus rosea]
MTGEFRLRVHESLPSTQSLATELAERGEPAGLAILARRQTEGRGRAGRAWQSVAGNLHLSLLLRPGGAARDIAGYALMAAVALHEAALHHAPGRPLVLKWPNDLMEGSAKIAGILSEAALDAHGGIAHLVCGIGVNLAHAPAVEGRAVAALGPIAPEIFAATLLSRLADWHKLRLTEGFAPIRAAWMERGPERGSLMTLRQGDNPVSGRYEGLAEDGGLLLATAGRLHAFHAGEVMERYDASRD